MPAKPPAPSDIADKFMLRLPDGMRDRLKDEAAKNNRSMNAEIVARLSHSLDYPAEMVGLALETEAAFARDQEAQIKRLEQLVDDLAASIRRMQSIGTKG